MPLELVGVWGLASRPISGAHFNPAESVVQALRGEMAWRHASAYAVAQICGCCLGMFLAHGMFGLPLLQASTHMRMGQWLSDAVATAGLVLVVMTHRRPTDVPWLVAASTVRRLGLPHRHRLPIRQSRLPARSPIRFQAFDRATTCGFILAQFAGVPR